MWKRLAIGLGALLLVAASVLVTMMGPRNVIGMLRYDQRKEGPLRVGDRAPDVELLALDGKTPVRLASQWGERPTVVVFGSFT